MTPVDKLAAGIARINRWLNMSIGYYAASSTFNPILTPEKKTEMTQTSENPLIKRLLARGATAAHDRAKVTKNPRAALQCPDGPYFAQVKQVRMTEMGKAGTVKEPAVEVRMVLICHAGDEHYKAGDLSWMGEQPRSTFSFNATEKRTEDEAYGNFHYSMQDLGFDTGPLIMHESLRTDPNQYTWEELFATLSQEQPFVKITVQENKSNPQYRNVNIRQAVTREDLAQLLGQDPVGLIGGIPLKEETAPDQGGYDYAAEAGTGAPQQPSAPQTQYPAFGGKVYEGEYHIYHDGQGGYIDLESNPIDINGNPLSYEPQPGYVDVPTPVEQAVMPQGPQANVQVTPQMPTQAAPAVRSAPPLPVQRPAPQAAVMAPAQQTAPAPVQPQAVVPKPTVPVQRPAQTAPAQPQPMQRAVAAPGQQIPAMPQQQMQRPAPQRATGPQPGGPRPQ